MRLELQLGKKRGANPIARRPATSTATKTAAKETGLADDSR